jgi:hypothetical protein
MRLRKTVDAGCGRCRPNQALTGAEDAMALKNGDPEEAGPEAVRQRLVAVNEQ